MIAESNLHLKGSPRLIVTCSFLGFLLQSVLLWRPVAFVFWTFFD